MCGISGAWERESLTSLPIRLDASLAAIHHRGPDDTGRHTALVAGTSGRIALGTARLAILDLSPAGHMPMMSADERFVITYNGEVTNYVELRAELKALGRTFRSDGDTEVLLQGWEQWGEEVLPRLEGMFAFAMLDTRDRRLTLVRDAFGVKPLYYGYDGSSLQFCSELPGLLALRTTPPKLNWQTATDFVLWGTYDDSAATFISGVNQLMPAHSVTLDLVTGQLGEARRYWWPSIKTDHSVSRDDAADRVRELFLRSVTHNLRSDVPVGVALSGGIDSSAIACAVRAIDPDYPLKAFSFVSPGFAESEDQWIDRIVEHTGALGHTTSATGNGLSEDLDTLILAQGEPFRSTSIYAQMLVFKLARENGVVVTLDGQGADEAFGGYSGFPGYRAHSLIETGQFGAASRFLDEWASWPGRSLERGRSEMISQLAPARIRAIMARLRGGESPLVDGGMLHDRGVRATIPIVPRTRGARGIRMKEQLRSQLLVRGLPALLRHGDRNSMHYSVESRVPFLDKELVQFSLSLPENYLVADDGTSKSILRRAMRGIVPDDILDRRDKVGFSTPERDWLEEFDRAGSSFELADIPFLRPSAPAALDDGVRWRMLNLRRWVVLLGIDPS